MTTQVPTASADRMSLPVKPPPPGISDVAPCSMAPPPGPGQGGQAVAAGTSASLGASSSGHGAGPTTPAVRPL
eukprot:1027963-Lingulodinium_polyedra.AAC.1